MSYLYGNLLKAQDIVELNEQEAWKIVREQVLYENFKDFNVYVSKKIIPPGQELEEIRKIISPDFSSFFFFIDEEPLANWAHPCKYCFVNILTGEIKIINSDLPPDFENLEILHFIEIPSKEFIPFDFSSLNKQILNSSVSFRVIIYHKYN